jgi:hypothetical protein
VPISNARKKTPRIEHRFGARKPHSLPVEIHHHGRYIGCFRTANISYQGAFVKAEDIDLYCNDFVQLSMMIHDVGDGSECTIKALVLHRSGHGIGLMFADDSPAFVSLLHALMRLDVCH